MLVVLGLFSGLLATLEHLSMQVEKLISSNSVILMVISNILTGIMDGQTRDQPEHFDFFMGIQLSE